MAITKQLQSVELQTSTPLIRVMSKRQQIVFHCLIAIWLLSLAFFWAWWIQSHHVVTVTGMLITSLLLAWNTLLPGYYFYFVARMRQPNPKQPIPKNWRVAMVVTKAPSEPWAVVQKTLKAMLAQHYPHDTWLADEEPQTETVVWCNAHGVGIVSRQGVAEYHQPKWPRRTKCKEGNLAYFYDKIGYKNYDFVAQVDADHVPTVGYLEAMICPFVAPTVGYVAAPSICDANSNESWVVNARLFAEATMHGSLQAGYNEGWAPLCIGSHYAVRTTALKEIGGLGPELAEDHTTTLMMNAHGWKGVFAIDAEAHGDGPTCFSDFVVQEFQWSRSLMMVLLSVTPHYWKHLTFTQRFQFIFSQLWYPLFGISMFVGSLIPIIALITDVPWVRVSYFEFLLRYLILNLTCLVPVLWINKQGWLRPRQAKVISWETMLFQFARWPWVLYGILHATFCWAIGKELQFKVTPKGKQGPKPLPFKVVLPYLALGLIATIAAITINNARQSQGYYFITLLNGGTYISLTTIILFLHIRENHQQIKLIAQQYVKIKVTLLSAIILFFTATWLRFPEAIKGITWTNNWYSQIKFKK